MRSTLAAASLLLVVGLMAGGQERKGKNVPTDEAIVSMVGGRLFKMFAQFGTPEDLYAVRSEAPEMDSVILEYNGAFAFTVLNKTVTACHFSPGWKGKAKGISLGDSREQVIRTLGQDFEDSVIKNDDGVFDCSWDLVENDARLWVIFDKNDKVKSVSVQLK